MGWFWNTEPSPDASGEWITWKTIAFVGVCGVCIWGLANLVSSVGDTTEKIDDIFDSSKHDSSSSEESSDDH